MHDGIFCFVSHTNSLHEVEVRDRYMVWSLYFELAKIQMHMEVLAFFCTNAFILKPARSARALKIQEVPAAHAQDENNRQQVRARRCLRLHDSPVAPSLTPLTPEEEAEVAWYMADGEARSASGA